MKNQLVEPAVGDAGDVGDPGDVGRPPGGSCLVLITDIRPEFLDLPESSRSFSEQC